jgi:hypothetical protein
MELVGSWNSRALAGMAGSQAMSALPPTDIDPGEWHVCQGPTAGMVECLHKKSQHQL